jgi:hypothetical protein
MNIARIALALTAFAAAACSGADPTPNAPAPGAPNAPVEDPAATGTTAEALTTTPPAGVTNIQYGPTVTIGLCSYAVGWGQNGSLPPENVILVHKYGFLWFCANQGYQQIGSVYGTPSLAAAVGAGSQLAVSFNGRSTPSGSAPVQATVLRLNTNDLTTQLATGLAIPPPFGGYVAVETANLVFTVPGDLIVTGTKVGTFNDGSGHVLELGGVGGPNYQATFPGFATASGPLGASQILAW